MAAASRLAGLVDRRLQAPRPRSAMLRPASARCQAESSRARSARLAPHLVLSACSISLARAARVFRRTLTRSSIVAGMGASSASSARRSNRPPRVAPSPRARPATNGGRSSRWSTRARKDDPETDRSGSERPPRRGRPRPSRRPHRTSNLFRLLARAASSAGAAGARRVSAGPPVRPTGGAPTPTRAAGTPTAVRRPWRRRRDPGERWPSGHPKFAGRAIDTASVVSGVRAQGRDAAPKYSALVPHPRNVAVDNPFHAWQQRRNGLDVDGQRASAGDRHLSTRVPRVSSSKPVMSQCRRAPARRPTSSAVAAVPS